MVVLYCLVFMLVVAVVIGVIYAYNYNQLQHSQTKIEHAECLIDESLRAKYDLLCQYEDLIKESINSNKEFLKNISKLKDENISNFDLDRKLTEYENLVTKFNSDNEEISNNKEFKKLNSETKKINEKLQASKSYYNKYTNELNDLIRTFPSNIVSRLHQIDIKPFFDGKNMQDEIIDDFKL